MMIVCSVQYLDVQVHAGCIADRIEKLSGHLCIHISKTFCGKFTVKVQIRATGQIDTAKYQCLVHGKNHASITANPCFIAQCFFNSRPQYDSGIFDRVMAVHIQIAVYGKIQIKESMTCKSIQHMVKKSDAGIQAGFSGSVQIQTHRDLRLFGISLYQYITGHTLFFQSANLHTLFLPFKTHCDRVRMCGQLFTFCKLLDIFVDRLQRFSGVVDDTGFLHKIIDRQWREEFCGSIGWKNVVWSCKIIAKSLRTVFAHKA